MLRQDIYSGTLPNEDSQRIDRLQKLRDIYREESPRALFKGLGPTLVGAIPARSINFYTYGNGKHIIANNFNDGKENTYVHLASAAIAGIVTGTATNPIWVVKTRLQLSASRHGHVVGVPIAGVNGTPLIGGSWATIKQIMREEGIKGFYKGLSASYLGVTEGTIQWVLYERLKLLSRGTEGKGGAMEWLGMLGSAGTAKCVASLITYPHEVGLQVSVPFFTYLWVSLNPHTGNTDPTTSTHPSWPNNTEIPLPLANPPSCHRRGGCQKPLWRPERASDACGA